MRILHDMGMAATGAAPESEEPGAVDNRLTLDPSEFPAIEDWEDGETYPISDLGKATIRQISAGEFEVMPAAEKEEVEEKAPAKPKPKRKPLSSNPAVDNLAYAEE